MRSILEQLDSNESILLMYLADELPAADRLEIDKRLAADEALRAQLEQLRGAHQTITQALTTVDAAQPLPGSSSATQRGINRMIRQWQADRLREQAQQPIKISAWRRYSWAYPWAAAAVIAVGYIIWWGTQPATELPGNPQALNYFDDPARQPSTQDVLADAEKDTLADTERDLQTVSYLREMTSTQ